MNYPPLNNKPLKAVRALLFSALLPFALHIHSARAQSSLAEMRAKEAQRDWMRADLTLDNSKYAAIRAQINTSIRQGRKPAALEASYRLQKADTYDPEKIFRWAYAAYRVQKVKPDANVLYDIGAAMNRVTRPGAYDWVRLRYLIASLPRFSNKNELIPVGRRLLRVKYNDEEVMFHFLRQLQGSQSMDERRQGLSLAMREADKRPTDPYWRWLVSDANLSLWHNVIPRDRKYNLQSIAEAKKVLDLLPKNDPNRQLLIERIVSLGLAYDVNGKPQKRTLEMIDEAMRRTPLR